MSDKITYRRLQELYDYHFRNSTSHEGATYFRRREIFKLMAEDLNKEFNLGIDLNFNKENNNG